MYKKHKMVGVAFIDLMRWCDITLAVDIAPRPRPARLKYNFIFIIYSLACASLLGVASQQIPR